MYFLDDDKCCGCSACFNICPKRAISMKKNDEGFLYPIIDKNKCVKCGLCEKVCPVLKQKSSEKITATYAVKNKDDIVRLSSSSGGVFYSLASYIIKNDGYVVAATYDDKFNVVHEICDSLDNLNKFMGSKYVQSDLKDNFIKVKKLLDDQKVVLFVGTPCQVSGLYSFLKKEYTNLYLVDVICHGVPSPLVYKNYIESISALDKINSISFRNKKTGWQSYSFTISHDKGVFSERAGCNIYFRGFLNDIFLRKSCYNCQFKLHNKHSDITLGDFWKIQKVNKSFYDNKGVSAVIINSAKGSTLFDECSSDFIIADCSLNDIISGNPSLISAAKFNENRNVFFENIKITNVNEAIIKSIGNCSVVKKYVFILLDKLKSIM